MSRPNKTILEAVANEWFSLIDGRRSRTSHEQRRATDRAMQQAVHMITSEKQRQELFRFTTWHASL